MPNKLRTLTVFVLAMMTTLVAGADSKKEGRARVFVPVSDSWSIGGEFANFDEGGFGEVSGGARPQTAEIVKTLHDRCPSLIVTRKEERADYILVLQHEGGKFIRKDNKFAVFNADGDAIDSGSTRSLGNAVKEACATIGSDWAELERTER